MYYKRSFSLIFFFYPHVVELSPQINFSKYFLATIKSVINSSG